MSEGNITFRQSDKVVCIDDRGYRTEPVVGSHPVNGRVYVVREVLEHPLTGQIGVNLVGIQLARFLGFLWHRAYRADRFRRLEGVRCANEANGARALMVGR